MLAAFFQLSVAFLRAAFSRRRAWRSLEIPASGTASAAEKRRFYHYYFGTSYLAVLFSNLLGRNRSPRERRLFVRLAALAAFFDDLSEHPLSFATDDLEAYGRLADPRGLAWYFLQNVRRELTLDQTPFFENELKKVFEYETGQTQLTDIASILWHTGDKGGHSVLLFRALLSPAPTGEEHDFLFAFGRLIQLCDDIFDVWFDAQNRSGKPNIVVYLLEENNPKGLVRVFESQVASVRNLILGSGLKGKRQAWATVCFLVALTRVALRHYSSLQTRYGEIPLYDRSSMVVDMGRWRNRWRLLREILRKTGAPPDLH